MMSEITTAAFLSKGSSGQFRYVLSLYDTALELKAGSKSKKPEELIKLDKWYQNDLPKKMKARGSTVYIIHDELVHLIKWKLARGKFRPRLKELVTMNSPRLVEQESKKAFRALFKKGDLPAAIQYLTNLKGVNPATASAIVTAVAPDKAAYMADECLAAVPEIEGIDYTIAEYLEMLKHILQCVDRLGGPEVFTPHQIELALWTHNILLTFKPELLKDMPIGEENGVMNDNENDNEPTQTAIQQPQEDSLGSAISTDSNKEGLTGTEDSNSNQEGLNHVLPNEDSNSMISASSEKGEDSNSVDAFTHGIRRKNGDVDPDICEDANHAVKKPKLDSPEKEIVENSTPIVENNENNDH